MEAAMSDASGQWRDDVDEVLRGDVAVERVVAWPAGPA
jgi:hypothetical protein